MFSAMKESIKISRSAESKRTTSHNIKGEIGKKLVQNYELCFSKFAKLHSKQGGPPTSIQQQLQETTSDNNRKTGADEMNL
jgi:hypothetical protein